MNLFHAVTAEPVLLIPIAVFCMVFGLAIAVTQRQPVVSARLARHRVSTPGAGSVPLAPGPSFRLPRLPRLNAFTRIAALVDNEQAQAQARTLLKRAGNPMSPAAYAQMRRLFIFLLTPVLAVLMLALLGREPLGFVAAVVMIVTVPRLPAMYLKRRAKQRGKEMESVIPDALDLLVVCVEGGQSLSAGLMQVSKRMDNVAAEEFSYLLSDFNSGLSRRDAFLALADRCQSEALDIACTTIVQADKVGMSIASTLRTLSEMMRTRRRRAAETKARQAPIKMMPVLVGFVLPTMLALLLGPVALELMEVFK
jgi:tight adherence protein C